MADELIIRVVYTKSTANYLCYENPDMDFREKGSKVKFWFDKKNIEPRGYIPGNLEIAIRQVPEEFPLADPKIVEELKSGFCNLKGEEPYRSVPLDDDDVPF